MVAIDVNKKMTQPVRPKYFFAFLNGTYRVMRASKLDSVFLAWTRALLCDKHADKLLSVTRSATEMSMIVSTDLPLPDHEEAGLVDAGTYYALQLYTDQPGLYETDILAPITAFFAAANIAILCVSTFNYNYLLVPTRQREAFERAVEANDEIALEAHGPRYEYS